MADFLNNDVFYHVLQQCSTSTLKEFSLVSSRCRVLALPHLLHHVSISRSPNQLMAFLNYVLKKTPQSDVRQPTLGTLIGDSGPGKYVHRLEIIELAFNPTVWVCDGPEEESYLAFADEDNCSPRIWAPMLTQVLRLLANIRVIEIDDCLEDILINSPEFAMALFSRPYLVEVGLGSVGLVASKCLGEAAGMNEPLRLEKMQFRKDEHMEVLVLTKSEGMGSILVHVRKQLTELDIYGADLCPFLGSGDNDVTDKAMIFPEVTTLALTACYVSSEALATSFPSLRDLTLGFEVITPSNEVRQSLSCLHLNLVSIKGFYQDLRDFLRTSSHPQLRRVFVESIWTKEVDETFSVTRMVPQLRSLHFAQIENTPLSWWKGLSITLACLTYMSISLPARNMEDLNFVLDEVPGTLHIVPLIYLSLTLCKTSFKVDDEASPTVERKLANNFIAKIFAESIPTLEYIDVCKKINGKRELLTWWTVTRDIDTFGVDNPALVKALSAAEGKYLRNLYDLEA